MCYLRHVCTWIWKRTWLAISTVLTKPKEFWRSQTVTYIHFTCFSISETETVTIQTADRKRYTAYRISTIPTTLSDLQGHLLIATFFKWDFSYSCEADDRISTGIARRAISVQQLSTLFYRLLESIVIAAMLMTRHLLAGWEKKH